MVLCWGFIKWDFKGSFFVWSAETEEERLEAEREILRLNKLLEEEAEEKNRQWKASAEFTELKARELAEARRIRKAAKVNLSTHYTNLIY